MASLFDVTVGEETQLRNIMSGAGLTDEHVRAILRDPKLAAAMIKALDGQLGGARKTRIVTVDYSLPLSTAIARGDFTGYVNPDITIEHFPATRVGKERVTLEVVHLDKLVTTQEVLDCFKKNNLRAATIEELLAACAKDKTLGKDYPHIAFASFWQHPDGSADVPCARWGADGRELHLRWDGPALHWGENYRFVAVRKV